MYKVVYDVCRKDCADPDTENARLKVMLEEEQGHAEDVARRARVMIQVAPIDSRVTHNIL